MRVLHVMADGAQGGGGAHLTLLLPALRALGIESAGLVGAGPTGGVLRAAGFAAEGLDLFRSRVDPTAPLRLARAVRGRAPDLVHYHGTRAAFFGALARGWARAPVVYTAHGVAYRREGAPIGRAARLLAEVLACRAATQVICVSEEDAADLRRRGAVGPGRVSAIANAVDTARFAPGDRAAARARLGVDAGAFVVGAVSRLVPQKALEVLVDAARCADLEVVIAGDGPERERLLARAEGRVRFLGAREDVPELLRALDVFALPSRWEGEPIGLLEAMAVGLACVASDIAGPRALLAGGAGVLVPPGDAAALGSAIADLRAAPARRAELGAAARAVALRRSPEEMARAVARVYSAALSRSGG